MPLPDRLLQLPLRIGHLHYGCSPLPRFTTFPLPPHPITGALPPSVGRPPLRLFRLFGYLIRSVTVYSYRLDGPLIDGRTVRVYVYLLPYHLPVSRLDQFTPFIYDLFDGYSPHTIYNLLVIPHPTTLVPSCIWSAIYYSHVRTHLTYVVTFQTDGPVPFRKTVG